MGKLPAWMWILLAVGATALVPVVMTDPFFLRLFTEALMWIGLAITWDLVAGYTGYLNFGHGVSFGIGAYAAALLIMRAGWPF
ncbi:MAG TPA: branched-chain amino acid ABC transporter permease, partial [Candidatus Methylomirabilis sp.]|nr:branched-chain amino acid ABC transporter permease [Candidatus Methylomirabilis sp.]